MSEKTKTRIVVDEDVAIVERLDNLANAEGITRADMMRRAIRRLVFSSPNFPNFGNIPERQTENQPADIAA